MQLLAGSSVPGVVAGTLLVSVLLLTGLCMRNRKGVCRTWPHKLPLHVASEAPRAHSRQSAALDDLVDGRRAEVEATALARSTDVPILLQRPKGRHKKAKKAKPRTKGFARLGSEDRDGDLNAYVNSAPEDHVDDLESANDACHIALEGPGPAPGDQVDDPASVKECPPSDRTSGGDVQDDDDDDDDGRAQGVKAKGVKAKSIQAKGAKAKSGRGIDNMIKGDQQRLVHGGNWDLD